MNEESPEPSSKGFKQVSDIIIINTFFNNLEHRLKGDGAGDPEANYNSPGETENE